MATKHVVCSFDYTNDGYYYRLLTAWNNNPNIGFRITDCTPSEIQTESVGVIKNVLSRKIGEANYMIAIIGKHSADEHRDHVEIGYRNWQAYEIAKNAEKGNGLVIVRLDKSYEVPSEAYGQGARWVEGFTVDGIKQALDSLGR